MAMHLKCTVLRLNHHLVKNYCCTFLGSYSLVYSIVLPHFLKRFIFFCYVSPIFSLYYTFFTDMVLSNKLLTFMKTVIILQWSKAKRLMKSNYMKYFNNVLKYFQNSGKWTIPSLRLPKIIYYTCHFKANILTQKKSKILFNKIC